MEIELKYSVSQETGKKIMRDLEETSGARVRDIPMEAVYFDTSDRALREKKLTYRIRREGDENVLTIKYGRGSDKATSGLYRREEINIPVSPDFIEKPGIDVLDDTPVYKEFDKAVGGQYSDDLGIMLPLKPLVPVMRMEFLRKVIIADLGDGGKAAVSYDEGRIIAGEKETSISEVEAELYEGNEEELMKFGEKLAKKYDISPLNKSKYARGLKLLDDK